MLNQDWRFYSGDEQNADFMGFDDSAWREVTLPHDWSVEHPFDKQHSSGTGYLPGGTAWYRKHFTLPEDIGGKRVRVTFGGVYKHARVWINSNYLGSRAYGYSTFTYDISAFVRAGENVLCVRVEHEDVADSRWFTGSGIYRDVTLEISDPCSFETNGIFISTVSAHAGHAVLRIQYETANAHSAEFAVLDRDGRQAALVRADGAAGETQLELTDPVLWSPDSPAMYTLTARAVLDDAVTDEKHLSFGIRTIRFDADRGFFLNGVNMKLKGVCVHHDAGALGAAVPKEVWVRRLLKFKAAGCNALRTAHNPPDPLLLDACDELGLLVMDEAFDEWEGAKNKWWQGHNVYPPKRFGYALDFPQWHEQDLSDMVLRDRNHPCVIIWSIGNEIDYPNDPYVTPLFKEVLGNNDANKPAQERLYDARKPDAGRLAVLAKELTDIVHKLDDTRPVTSAMSFPELSTRTGFSDALDIWGYNYKENFYDEDRLRFPQKVILGSENSHSPDAWNAVARRDCICGQFLWTGVDFLGECRGWPVRISQAGMLDTAGFEKPLYYMRKAMWTDTPFIRLCCSAENEWTQRFAWQGEDGAPQTVFAYTNQPEAELFVNGRSLGRQKAKDCCVLWHVPFEAGELRGEAGGERDILRTPGPAEKLVLVSDRTALPPDRRSVAQTEVYLTDADGVPVSGRDLRVHFRLVGDGELLGIENGMPDDLTPYSAPYRQTFNGRAIVYIRSGSSSKKLRLFAWTDSGLSAELEITQEV